MLNIPEYNIIGKIYESSNSLVYRGIFEQNNQRVILKFLKQDYPTPAELTRYKQEYEVTRSLNISGVIKAYSLKKYQNTLVIIFEDFGGESLKNWISQRQFTLEEILEIAIEITEILGEIHQANVIHKDLNPSNIVFNPDTKKIKIIDFGISTLLTSQNPLLKNPNILEGTLSYISPEQTGRMNRCLDYRTDFYSLGVTFYELLTQQLPFDSNDALELVHFHLAQQPIPPHKLNPIIPKIVSNIVLKLLEKNAEDRYQSSRGIVADLQKCLTQLANGKISEFPLATNDFSEKFQIPQKLYGRETEINTLIAAFERVSQGKPEMMLVAGYSGIGKSVLVQEIYQPITKKRGYFISGKFDQFQRNIPYSAIVSAFSELVGQLLTESEIQLQQWREKILAVLGPNGQVIIDVIPEVELIIGQQPPVQKLGLKESQNRFNLVFQNFIRACASVEHPLVIFLDDLQWADLATLNLIELIMTDTQTNSLFLIGAYRDNEVSPTHPLMMILDHLYTHGVIINQITLKPLAQEHIANLIADTLYSDIDTVKPLAELVLYKTAGNPFFVNEFMKNLYQEKLLIFDSKQRIWQWNIQQIQALGITDNVVDLMVIKLNKLPESAQQVLSLAACVGNTFDLNTLSIINEKSTPQIFKQLMPAMKSGLIQPISDLEIAESVAIDSELLILNYKFLHDRVQQAAYSLIEDSHKQEIHLKIGKLLLENLEDKTRSERIFEMVEHLNAARELIVDSQEKIELAYLNLEVGKKAKESTAYATAREYFIVAIKSCNQDVWHQDYELALALHRELAEVEYLNGNFEQSEALIKLILVNANSAIDQAEIYCLMITEYTVNSKYSEAIKVGRVALKLLDIELPELEIKTVVNTALVKINKKLRDQNFEELLNQPDMANHGKKIALKLLSNLISPAYLINLHLVSWIGMKMVDLSLEYGLMAESSYGYTTYGFIISEISAEYQLGYQFGYLGLKIAEKFNHPALKCRIILMLGNNLLFWVKHLRLAEPLLQEGYQASLASGDLQHAGYLLLSLVFNPFEQGKYLEDIFKNISEYLCFCQRTQNKLAFETISGLQLSIANLLGMTTNKLSFNLPQLSEEEYLQNCQQHQSSMAVSKYYTLKSHILYLYDQPTEALNYALLAQPFLQGCLGHYTIAEHNFLYSLNLAALYEKAAPETQKEYWQQLEINQKQMKIWAENCPDNFQHKYLLVAAEQARITGKTWEAMQLYKQAIQSAKENEFIQHEALAHELAAKFFLGTEFAEYAALHIKQAHYYYKLWGAKCKVEDLSEKYPQLLTTNFTQTQTIHSTTTSNSTSSNSYNSFDISTVIKAAQAISGEIFLDKLLAKLMKIILENGGARTGFLILPQDGKLLIEAALSIDSDLSIITPTLVEKCQYLPVAIINYVERSRQDVVLTHAAKEGKFTNDPYIILRQLKSVLCTPIVNQGQLIAILYLENNLTVGAFTPERIEVLRVLSSQAAIAIANALLYASVEQKVQQRTQELNDKNLRLSQTLEELQITQSQLIQSEKMSSLGQLVGGVAHEINNPVNFIYANLTFTKQYVFDLLNLIRLYQEYYPNPVAEIQQEIEVLELDFLVEDLQKILNSMKLGAERIRDIVLSLRNFSRLDEADMKPVNLYEGIDSTLLILNTKIQETPAQREIELIKEYAQIPLVTCYASQINQVFMNILTNAIDAVEYLRDRQSYFGVLPRIKISTELTNFQTVKIIISDNGYGISAEVLPKIFDPFFTTKPVGSGTGLGLSISYSIIVNKHGGQLNCNSQIGKGSEFIIEIPLAPKKRFNTI